MSVDDRNLLFGLGGNMCFFLQKPKNRPTESPPEKRRHLEQFRSRPYVSGPRFITVDVAPGIRILTHTGAGALLTTALLLLLLLHTLSLLLATALRPL